MLPWYKVQKMYQTSLRKSTVEVTPPHVYKEREKREKREKRETEGRKWE